MKSDRCLDSFSIRPTANLRSSPSSGRTFRGPTGFAVALLCCVLVLVGCSETETNIEQIRALQARGFFEPTIEPLRVRIDRGERDSETLLLYGVALTNVRLYSRALWPLKEAARDPERFVPAMMQLAGSAYKTGNHDLAIEILGDVLEQEPDFLPAVRMRAFARLHSRRDYEGALEDAEHAIDLDPQSTTMLAPRIVALFGLNRVEEAKQALDEFAERPADPEAVEGEMTEQVRALACVARAKLSEEEGHLELAGERYDECVEEFPSQAIAVHEAMEFFGTDASGKGDRFDEILKAAYEAAPHDRSFRIAYARRQQLLGNIDEAEAVLEEASAFGYPGAILDLAGFLNNTGDVEGALEVYRAARAEGASGASFLLTFGEALIAAGELDEALAVADQTGPESHRAFIRGRVALKKMEYEKALENLTQGVLLWPDNAVARYYTAIAAEGVGEFDRAIEEYRTSLRIDANAADSRKRLAMLHLGEGDPLAALYILNYQTQKHEPLRNTDELALLELEALAWAGRARQLPPELQARIRRPRFWGAAVAALAKGARHRDGAASAVAVVKNADRLNLASTGAAPALRELIENLVELGRKSEAIEAARSAASTNPQDSESQTLLGEALLLSGELDEADASFVRALELDATHRGALVGRASLAIARNQPEQALGFYDQVTNVNAEVLRGRAEALVRLGREEEAEADLIRALGQSPYEGQTALQLVELKRAVGVEESAVRSLVERATRFGAGESSKTSNENSEPDRTSQSS
jgi:tetratricopeptide (TPR) repeat protein